MKRRHACINSSLQASRHARVGVARSRIHGWGAFALERIEEGQLVYEYTGERVSQREVDRRGILYDRVARSYVFNTDTDTAIDALRYGNKIKFANHSPQPNLMSALVMVLGERRVGLFARRVIYPGEELSFSYRYSEEHHRSVKRS
jgi:histone-lysine N-methyltransferase EZH2